MTNLLSFWRISIALIVLSFSFNCVNAQYCVPNFYNDFGDHIANVSTYGAIIDLNNSTGSDTNGYGDYSATHSVTAVAGTTFDINVTYVSCWAGVSVWIDWDNSGTFEFSERVISTDNIISPQISSITASNTTGSYRMRVIAQCFTNKPSNPCPSNGWDGEAEDYTLIVVEQNPCSGTPNAGTITINPTQANAGNIYIISATGQSLVDFDYTYQWQSNTNNQGWENVDSAMTFYSDLTQIANTTQGTIVEYRLIVTCTNSNLFETSNIVSFKTHKEYCFPKYIYNGNILSINNINKYINDFSTSSGIVNISNLNSGRSSDGYADYFSTHQAMFNSGENVNFQVNLTHVSSSVQHSIGIWIDWNNDGNFDSTELVYVSPALIPWNTNSISDSFLIPSDISEGYYRMRLVHKLDDSLVDDPCLMNYGDVEDYSLIVVSSSCLPPIQLNSTPNTLTKTTLSWTTVGNETNFDVEWGNELFALGTGTKINGITSNSVLVNAITNKKYEFYVRTNCGNGNYSAWSGPFRFHTGYCVPEYINNQIQCGSITNFEINDAITNLANDSGISPCSPESSYSDFTDMYAEANQGSTLSFNVKSSINGTSKINIWVDWNKNGVFETEELLVNSFGNTHFLIQGYNGVFTLPSNIISGNYRLRVRVVWFSNGQPQNIDACSPYSYSQAEDYTLKILGTPCIVNIPDANFKIALLNHNPVIDLNGDGEIQCSEAEAVTGAINVSNKSISNLTGIEAFVNMTNLNCNSNNLTSIDISNNTALTTFRCQSTGLTSLDISNNIALNTFVCAYNSLTSLDVSNNTALTSLNCTFNDLTSLDVSNNTALTNLRCFQNQIANLDVSNNTDLTTLMCSYNQLTSLDVSNNTDLTQLWCDENQIENLDVSNNTALTLLNCSVNQLNILDVSNNVALANLICHTNQLATLDVSNNIDLTNLTCHTNQLATLDVSNNSALLGINCQNNQLTSLNIKNGNNSVITNNTFRINNNPNLNCVEVDDPDWSTANWTTYIDSQTAFSENCNPPCVVNISNANFKNALLNHIPVIDLNGDGEIQCDEAEAFTETLIVYNENISDLTGIEAFINITGLDCSLNQLTSLEVSQNTALQYLNCGANQLTNLDTSNNADLEWLYCHNNQLTNLDVSNNTNLIILYCTNNQFTNLDLTNNINLIELNCYDNPLAFLNVTSNTALEILGCASTGLTTLDISNNTNLKYLDCVFNSLTNLDLSNNTNLEELYCYDNQLTSLDVNNNTALIKLSCSSNSITTLDVSNNTLLKDLSCYSNQLTSLDLSNNTALETLDSPNNQLLSLNAKNGNNSNMWYFDTHNNPNLICIEVDNVAYSNTNWTNIDSQSCFSENCITPTFDEIGTICYGDTFSLDQNSQNGISGFWFPAVSNTQTQTYTFTPNTCANKTTMTVTVNNFIPTPTGETSQTFTAGQTIADLVVNGDNLIFYNSTYSQTFSLTDELVDSQTYYVVNEIGNCQSDPLIIIVTQVVSRTDFDLHGFSYHPNPVNDVLRFSSNSKIENITINNLLGQKINANLNSDNTILDMSDMPSGNYFVKVTIEGVSKTIKIIKD